MTSLAPHFTRDLVIGDLATAGSYGALLYVPEDIIVTKLSLADGTGVVAHASTIVTLTVTNKGTDGSGSTVIGVVTTDSDLTDTATRKSATLAANVPLVLDLSSENTAVAAGISGTEVAAGSLLEVAFSNASGLTLDDATATITYRPGSN